MTMSTKEHNSTAVRGACCGSGRWSAPLLPSTGGFDPIERTSTTHTQRQNVYRCKKTQKHDRLRVPVGRAVSREHRGGGRQVAPVPSCVRGASQPGDESMHANPRSIIP